MIPFPFNENRFYSFVADHLLVGQLCTNPKSDRSLLSCPKATQCSTSEIGVAPLYDPCSLPIQVMTTGQLPASLKYKSGLPRVMKTKFPATIMLFGVVSSKGHIMPPHIFEDGLKVNTKVYLDVLKSVVIPWCNQVAGGHKSKETQAWHTLRTSPTWPPTTPKPAWSPLSAEYSPSSRRYLWKSHAPSSGSVSKRWLRLKAATLNRCQLYFIIKLAELIFSIKVAK